MAIINLSYFIKLIFSIKTYFIYFQISMTFDIDIYYFITNKLKRGSHALRNILLQLLYHAYVLYTNVKKS